MDVYGKIIAVIGPQASGKSTLAKRLSEHIESTEVFYEGEQFPNYVIDAFDNPTVRIRAFLYFHNHWLNQYIRAEEVRKQGGVVILDAFWLTNLFYIDTLVDENERQLVQDLIVTASKLFNPPDGVIYLDIDRVEMDKRIQERSKGGNRPWEVDDGWLKEPLAVKQRHEDFIGNANLKSQILGHTQILKLNATAPNLIESACTFVKQA